MAVDDKDCRCLTPYLPDGHQPLASANIDFGFFHHTAGRAPKPSKTRQRTSVMSTRNRKT